VSPKRRDAEITETGPYTRQIETLSVDRFATLQTRAGSPLWQMGWQARRRAAAAWQGQVIVLADPTLLTARGLGRADNVMVLANIAQHDSRDGIVYFDEYHHGFQSGAVSGAISAIRPTAGVAAALPRDPGGGLAHDDPLGPATADTARAAGRRVDYASALARLYQKAGVRRLLGKSLTRGFLVGVDTTLKLA